MNIDSDTKDVLLILLPIVTAIISGLGGAYLNHYFTMRSKKNEAILKFKEEKYGNLLILLQGFVGKTAQAATKKAFFEEQYKSWLYSSDEVVKSVNNLIQNIIKELSTGKKVADITDIGKIVLAMRKDMLGKTKLKATDFRYTDVLND